MAAAVALRDLSGEARRASMPVRDTFRLLVVEIWHWSSNASFEDASRSRAALPGTCGGNGYAWQTETVNVDRRTHRSADHEDLTYK